jgi:hypothetical protein
MCSWKLHRGTGICLEGLLTDDGRLEVLAIYDKPDPLEGRTSTGRSTAPPRGGWEITIWRSGAVRQLSTVSLTRSPVHAEVRWNLRAPGFWKARRGRSADCARARALFYGGKRLEGQF